MTPVVLHQPSRDRGIPAGSTIRPFSPSRPIARTATAILLQHRAVLFGLLGVLLIAATFRPELRTVALVVADVLAVIMLLLAAGFEWRRLVVA